MRVLVHLNHRIEKTYLLTFGNSMTKPEIRRILDSDQNKATQALFMKSIKHVEIPSKKRQKAKLSADFVFSQNGYSSERLA